MFNLFFDDFFVFYTQKQIRVSIFAKIVPLLKFSLVYAEQDLVVIADQDMATDGPKIFSLDRRPLRVNISTLHDAFCFPSHPINFLLH